MPLMTKLNNEATAIFMRLINGFNDEKSHHTFDIHGYWPTCKKSSFMSVHVEKIGPNIYSVAHYFKQNGDLMSDPDMTFMVIDGAVYPCSFTQHSAGFYQESVTFNSYNNYSVNHPIQQQHALFANTWMINIADQQKI